MYVHGVKRKRLESKIAEVSRDCAALRSRMAARSVTRAYDEALRPIGLKVTQFTLLVAIRSAAFHSISEMAEWLALERSTLSRNLQILERRGLVERSDGAGGTARTLAITEEGETMLIDALPLWDAAQKKLKKSIGNESWLAAHKALKSLAKAG